MAVGSVSNSVSKEAAVKHLQANRPVRTRKDRNCLSLEACMIVGPNLQRSFAFRGLGTLLFQSSECFPPAKDLYLYSASPDPPHAQTSAHAHQSAHARAYGSVGVARRVYSHPDLRNLNHPKKILRKWLHLLLPRFSFIFCCYSTDL